VKTAEREQALLMRAQGRSVVEIARSLGVAKSTASAWVRDVPLTEEQRSALLRRSVMYEGRWKGAAANAAKGRERRRMHQLQGVRRAAEASWLYIAGCMLFWAEGDKCRNSVRMANSDPELLAFFARFLRDEFDVQSEQFAVSCNLFADHVDRIAEVEQFWLDALELSSANLRKPIVNRYSKYSQKKRQNRLPYGTCKLVVHSTRIVQTIYGSIQALAGFDREEWLELR
jgi:Homeodomain-like domain-containing protein